MFNPSLFIIKLILLALFPFFLYLLIKKYIKIKNFEDDEIFLSIFLGLISAGLGNIVYIILDFSIEWNLIELNNFLVKIDLILYIITLIFLFYFFILKTYKTNWKLSIIIRIIVIGLFIFALISIILIPIDPNTLLIDFSNPLVLIFLIFGFFITLFLSIIFTHSLIRKVGEQLEVNQLEISIPFLVIGFWISIFGTIITYITVSGEFSTIIYTVGYYIFIIGYFIHEPFRDLIETLMEKKIENIKSFNRQDFIERFGFQLPKNANLLLLHSDNIEKQNFISRFINFLNKYNIPSILLTPKGNSNKLLKDFYSIIDRSNISAFEYCVDKDLEIKKDEKCIKISSDLSILYETLKTTAMSFKNEEFYLFVDSLTDLITLHGYEKVYIFLKKITDFLKDYDSLSIFTINPEAHKTSHITSLEIIMDGILEMKEKKIKLIRF
ncbi:MAG: hypothetical protein EAX96_00725 [Candidatus Lokiarchaeota archaeon]|nr:hypothetical protein [Candidatus Lokiarchaeota archaeon]